MSFLSPDLQPRLDKLTAGLQSLNAIDRVARINEHFAVLPPLDRYRYRRIAESLATGQPAILTEEILGNFEQAFESALAAPAQEPQTVTESEVIQLGKSFGLLPAEFQGKLSGPNLRAYEAEAEVLRGTYPGFDLKNDETLHLFGGHAYEENLGLLRAAIAGTLVPQATHESQEGPTEGQRQLTEGERILESQTLTAKQIEKIVYQTLDDISIQLVMGAMGKGFQAYYPQMRDLVYTEVMSNPKGRIATDFVGTYAHHVKEEFAPVAESLDEHDLRGIFGSDGASSIVHAKAEQLIRQDAQGNFRQILKKGSGWNVSQALPQ